MVNVKDYGTSKGNYVNVKFVRSLNFEQNRAVVIGEGGFRKFEVKNAQTNVPEVSRKPFIELSILKQSFTWTMSKTAITQLTQEFGSSDTKDWVGGIIKLLVINVNGHETVSATVIEAPDKKQWLEK